MAGLLELFTPVGGRDRRAPVRRRIEGRRRGPCEWRPGAGGAGGGDRADQPDSVRPGRRQVSRLEEMMARLVDFIDALAGRPRRAMPQ